MARKPSVRYYASRKGGGYFCTIKGKLHELALGPKDDPFGPVYKAALSAFRGFLEMEAVDQAGDRNTVRVVLDWFLQRCGDHWSPATLRGRQTLFRQFVDWEWFKGELVGELPLERLTEAILDQFIAMKKRPHGKAKLAGGKERSFPGWEDATVRLFLSAVNAAFNHALSKKLISRNPLAGIRKPSETSRGADALVGKNQREIAENHRLILQALRPASRAFVQALKDTGARPGEIAGATAADFDSGLGAFVFRKAATRRAGGFSHKNARKGKDRVIILAGETLATVRRLVEIHPSGPLFRGNTGKPFRMAGWSQLFARLRDKLHMPHLTAYSYRHTFATECLKAGMPVRTLASLMGNSPAVIDKNYSHILADREGLRDKLEQARKAMGE